VPLGVEREAVFKEKSIEVRGGDRIFFFTDGLIENHLGSNAPMGRKNLLDLLSNVGSGNCHDIKDRTLESATKIFGSTNLDDDVTIVVAEIDANWVKGENFGDSNNGYRETIISEGNTDTASFVPVFAEAQISRSPAATRSQIKIDLPPVPTFSVESESTNQDESNESEAKKLSIKLPGAV
jgi:hypothetical protein